MNSIIKSFFKFVALDIYLPHAYNSCKTRPVDKKKVLLIEYDKEELSESFCVLKSRLEESPLGLDIHVWCMKRSILSQIAYIRGCVPMLKDMATAGTVFLSEGSEAIACIDKRPETKVIQLWHGCGAFKKFGKSTADLLFGSDAKEQKKHPFHGNYDLVCVSSGQVTWAYEEAMNISPEANIVRPIGISRTDVFFDDVFVDEAKKRVYSAFPKARGKKIILYAPTFRGNRNNAKAPDILDIEYMAKQLSDDHVLIIKQHPFVKAKDRPDIPNHLNGSFVLDMTDDMDTTDLLCAADILVSDYSSIIYEFSLFEKPMLFLAYDIDEYNDWRGFYYDYDELTPGPVISDTGALVLEINKLRDGFDPSLVKAFREKFMSACDGHSTERIMKFAFETAVDQPAIMSEF